MSETFFPEKFADSAQTSGRQTDVAQSNPDQPLRTRAYGVLSSTGPIHAMTIQRRALLPDDVAIDILYCGICHSDIHMIRGEWGEQPYPILPPPRRCCVRASPPFRRCNTGGWAPVSALRSSALAASDIWR